MRWMKPLLKLAALVVGFYLLVVVNKGWQSFSTKLHVPDSVRRNDKAALEQPTLTRISNFPKKGVDNMSSNDRTTVEQPTLTTISNVSKKGVDNMSSNERAAVERPTLSRISSILRTGVDSVSSNGRKIVEQPTLTRISNVSKKGVDNMSSNDRTTVEQPTLTRISNVSKKGVGNMSSNDRTTVEQPTLTRISNVSKKGVDNMSSNDRTTVEQPTLTRISNVSKKGVDNMSSNDRTTVEQPTLTRISNVSKKGVDNMSSNDRTTVEQPTLTRISNVSKKGVGNMSSNDRTTVEQPTLTRISNVSKKGVDNMSSNDRTTVEQPTLTRISNVSKKGVDNMSSNERAAVERPTLSRISSILRTGVDSVSSNGRKIVEQPTLTRISNVSKKGVDNMSSNDRTTVEQPTLTRISNVSKKGVGNMSSNDRTTVEQPTLTRISNVSKKGVDNMSSNDRTTVEQPTLTRISNVSKKGVDNMSSNDRTTVEQPTLTRISNVSKKGVDNLSSNERTDGAAPNPQLGTSQAVDFCNSPLIPVTGAEGEIPEGFQLRMVHILFRHGDRMPYFKGHDSTQYTSQDCDVNTNIFGRDDILEHFVQTMTKFAGKQPPGSNFTNFDLYPNGSKCGSAHLTGTGAAQLVQLGKYFREKYVTQTGLFSRDMPLTSQLYTCSSKKNRAYQSMIGFLYGFFGSTHFNLTNFNIVSSNHFFCSHDQPDQIKCNTLNGKIIKKIKDQRRRTYFLSRTSRNFIKSLKVSKEANSSSNFAATRISDFKQLVEKISTINSFTELADMISLTYCHNRSKLCSKDQAGCLLSNLFNRIWEKFDQENKYVNENPPKAKHLYATYYPILSKIADRAKDYISGKGQYGKKLFVYSGHGTSTHALLQILGFETNGLVPYAGRIVIELYESSSTFNENKHYIRIFYNGDDITQYVTFCKGKTFSGLCEFSLFYDFVYIKMHQLLKQSGFDNI